MSATIHHGDCLDVLRAMPDNSVDAVVTDPPYGLSNTSPDKVTETIVRWAQGDRGYVPQGKGFMGASWDAFVPPVAVWDECLRVLKPGGHLVAFAGSRTQDLMGLAIRLAGFDIRENLAWLYGSGFPKSLDVGKAIDKRGGAAHLTAEIGEAIKAARESRGWSRKQADDHFCGGSTNWTWFEGRPTGQRPPTPETFAKIVAEWPELADYASKVAQADREVIGKSAHKSGIGNASAGHYTVGGTKAEAYDITAPGTPEAEKWQGWGTALKPAHEPIILARKPIQGTVAANTLTWGTGGLNIDATRISHTDDLSRYERSATSGFKNGGVYGDGSPILAPSAPAGRWPANVVLDPDTAKALDQQSGTSKDGVATNRNRGERIASTVNYANHDGQDHGYGGQGGASRFFKVVEPDTAFREDLKSRTPRRSESNFDVATGRPLGPARLMERHVVEPDPPFMYAAKAPKRERPSYIKPVLRLREGLTPEQVDHVQARLREAGVEHA